MKLFASFFRPANYASSPSLMPIKLGVALMALVITILSVTLLPSVKYLYEEKVGAFFWTLFSDTTPEERITIVAIDEESLTEVGAWPWSRATLAKLSNQLADYDVSLQLYDIVFPESKTGDAEFVDSLSQHNSVIAQIPVLDGQQSIRSGVLAGALNKTRCQLPIPSTSNYLANTSAYSPIKTGHITPIVDADGIIRKQPPIICIDGEAYPSLALQGLLSSLEQGSQNTPSVSLVPGESWLAPSSKLLINSYFGLNIPLDRQGNMRLSYDKAPQSFQVVSAAKVLNGTAPKALLENTWVLVGATAFGLGDVVPTPYNGTTPGVELQARLLSSLLDGNTPYTPAGAPYLLLLEALAATLLLLSISQRNERVSAYGLPIATLVLPSLMVILHAYLLSHNLWLGWLSPALYTLLFGALLTLVEHAIIRDERHRILSHLSSYLPKSVAQHLIQTTPSGAIEAQRSELVVFSADLRNFSAYEESRPPEEAAALLHCFFVKATQIIEFHGGQVEEYTGDAVLASWSTQNDNRATGRALLAATQLQNEMRDTLPSSPPKGLEPLALGIGIERGPTLVGSIGPAHRRTHTLLGDTVTIALRIQEMTQDLAQPILIGECAARDLHGESLHSQGSFLLDGLRTPHVLFAPIMVDGPEISDLKDPISLRLVR